MLSRLKPQPARLRLVDLPPSRMGYSRGMKTPTPWYEVATKLRKEQRITLQQLADHMGCAKSTVGHWLTGRNPASLAAIKEIAMVLGTNEIKLLADDPFYVTDPHERAIINRIREVPPEYRAIALSMIDGALSGLPPVPAPRDDKSPE